MSSEYVSIEDYRALERRVRVLEKTVARYREKERVRFGGSEVIQGHADHRAPNVVIEHREAMQDDIGEAQARIDAKGVSDWEAEAEQDRRRRRRGGW